MPERADELFKAAEESARDKYESLVRLKDFYEPKAE